MGQHLNFQCSEAPLTVYNVEDILRQAIKERDSLLERRPEMKEFQKEIDRLLAGAGSFENRMTVLEIMIESSSKDFQQKTSELLNIW
ncbi:MAG: hypothetical protein GY749_16570 [Desulfobacteraceae bacterium]|nr:hypothetical protein [Desulfobacteraceae bacterium]